MIENNNNPLNLNSMKSLNRQFYRLFNFFLSGLLTLLGVSGCTKDSPVEYGSPSATFIVTGTISSAVSDEAVEDIKVVMVRDDLYPNDSTVTDGSGLFEVKDQSSFPEDSEYLLKIRDVDGEANGAFEDVDTTVVFEDPEFKGGDGNWNYGETSKEFNIRLTPKK
jgi:putative lipoprotein (rSAM/lipoprotein system)